VTAVLHARGSQLELEAGAALCRAASQNERVLGADILVQLGWGDRTCLQESVDILLPMLNDPDPVVIGAAAVALGHRNCSRAIAPVLALIKYPSRHARRGAVSALSDHDDLEAVQGLIELTGDTELDVRDWATFGLAQQTTLDTPGLRNALLKRTEDTDAEVRGEALIGLAARHDPRVLAPLARELSGAFYGGWSVEAATLLKAPSLCPLLVSVKERLHPDDLAAFGAELDQAIAVCCSAPESR
jgi:HEAT repeat protein